MFVLWRSYYLSCLYLFHLNVFEAWWRTGSEVYFIRRGFLACRSEFKEDCGTGNFSDNDWCCFRWHKITDESGDKIGDTSQGGVDKDTTIRKNQIVQKEGNRMILNKITSIHLWNKTLKFKSHNDLYLFYCHTVRVMYK